MLETDHVCSQISDYVLGLLPYSEQQQVETHAVTCVKCRQALQREHQIGRMIRETLGAASQPAPGRLSQLRPAIPVRRNASFPGFLMWQKQLAAVCLALMLLAGSAGLFWSNQSQGSGEWRPSFIIVTATAATATAATATMTSEPTATVAEVEATITWPAVWATPSPEATLASTYPQESFTLPAATPPSNLREAMPSAVTLETRHLEGWLAAVFALSN